MKTRDPLLSINVEDIPPEGFEREGDVAPDSLEFPEDKRFALAKDVHVDLFVSWVKRGVLCQGRVYTTLSCQCDRCLEAYEQEKKLSSVCHLFEEVTEDVLDLTDAIREDLLLEIPQHNLCSADCRGLCPYCGENRNMGECGCQPPAEGSDVWKVLDQLHLSE